LLTNLSSDRSPFDFEEECPTEIKTGTVTQIGQRNLSNWTSFSQSR
jgi:hypothetical protein